MRRYIKTTLLCPAVTWNLIYRRQCYDLSVTADSTGPYPLAAVYSIDRRSASHILSVRRSLNVPVWKANSLELSFELVRSGLQKNLTAIVSSF